MKHTLSRFLKTRKRCHPKQKYPRKLVDEILEYLRFRKVSPYIPKGARLLDIGTGDGSFLHYLDGHLHTSVGIDPYLRGSEKIGRKHFISGVFPDDYDADTPFDVITILATLEHIHPAVLPRLVGACWKYLLPGGQVIITVPHPRVDSILKLLTALRVFVGFSTHQHHGFNPECLPPLFKGFRLVKKQRWELGCNYLFIFEKPSESGVKEVVE